MKTTTEERKALRDYFGSMNSFTCSKVIAILDDLEDAVELLRRITECQGVDADDSGFLNAISDSESFLTTN